MGDDFIAELSDEQLNEYASSESIYASTEYIRTDMNGNQTTVSEEEALNASASVNPTAAPPTDDFVDDGGGDYPVYYDIMTDEYMKLVLVISYKGNAEYNFSVDATWLSEPTFHFTDSPGIAATDMAVSMNSCSGWYRYTKVEETVLSGEEISQIKENFNSDNSEFQLSSNGAWRGAAVLYNLPDNIVKPLYSTIYKEFKFHFEFTGTIRNPQLITNFNIIASYDHIRASLTLDPTISISIDGSVSIGISGVTVHDIRTIVYPEVIRYAP